MYLKQMELTGFKSFRERTKIALEPGVCCIVGPNGSGKSNISDALRWVLGEQSARSLRGGRLEDVIFSGSKKHKPVGMAEVSITLDNSDGHLNLPFTEVVITRRAFRSGQSEYLINNQHCRLKDISSLFLDSGMGLEGISLIGQGQIHSLIAARPEELRTLVEEAAGIIKYRNRKRESQRKLGETESHLQRVGDIIAELEQRLGPLQEQAERAREYLSLTEERDEIEIGLSLRILGEAAQKLAEIQAVMDEAASQALEGETSRLAIDAQAEALGQKLNLLDEELASLQEGYFQLQNESEKSSSRQKVLTAQKENTHKEAERLTGRLGQIQEQEAALIQEEQNLEDQAQALKAEIAEREKRLLQDEGDEESRRQGIALLEEKLEEAKAEAFEQANLLADCRNRLRYQQQLQDHDAAAKTRLLADQQALAQAAQALKEEEAGLEQALAEKSAALKQAESHWEDCQKEQQKSQAVITALAQEETACRYERQSLGSRLTMLEEMSQSGEGYFPGVRSILQAMRNKESQIRGVVDVIARLIEVPEAYTTAIETYLGAALQNIVTMDEKSARAAIEYLKSRKGGRATFLPLDIIKPRKKGDFSQVLRNKGVLGRASQLVECPDQVRPAVEFLLHNLLVVEDLPTASKAAKILQYRHSVVTLDGDMLNPGGSLSGGSANTRNQDLLGKRRRLLQSRQELAALEEKLAEQGRALAKAREAAALWDEGAEKAGNALAEANRALGELEEEKQQLSLKRNLQSQQEELIRQELKELMLRENLALSETEEINEEAARQEQAYAVLHAEIDRIQEELGKKRGSHHAEQADLTQYKVELARAQQSLVALKENIKRIAKSRGDLLWEQEEQGADLEAAQKELAECSGLLIEEKARFEALEQELAERAGLLESRRQGLSGESARLKELEAESRLKAKEIAQWQERLHQQELKKARLETEWQNEEAKLEEKIGCTFEEAQAAHGEHPLSKTAMSNRLSQLNRGIKALGAVNIGAIEEYAELEERYAFLTEQSQDLRDAKISLDRVIGEMDAIMSSRFKSTFQALSREFHKAFVRLFNGGEAALFLTEPEDILSTGVELMVKPPGKRVANYNLLSGGEKALCGIALMFAVLAVRPTPFCVMDEVDSSLDEANVERFGEYLKELSQNTQFVMISHRQGTMEAASSLWGITMEEEGISKIISVRLNKESKVS